MVTLIAFFLIASTCFIIAARLFKIDKKERNYFDFYFAWGMMLIGSSQTIGFVLSWAYLTFNNYYLLLWSDSVYRLLTLLSAALLVQIPLNIYFPKRKVGLFAGYLIGLYGVMIFVYSLTLNYVPTIFSSAILQWETPLILSLLFAIPISLIWGSFIVVFFLQYIKSGFRSIKPLMIGSGFFMAALSSILMDYGKGIPEYLLLNFILILGFILIFSSHFVVDRKPLNAR